MNVKKFLQKCLFSALFKMFRWLLNLMKYGLFEDFFHILVNIYSLEFWETFLVQKNAFFGGKSIFAIFVYTAFCVGYSETCVESTSFCVAYTGSWIALTALIDLIWSFGVAKSTSSVPSVQLCFIASNLICWYPPWYAFISLTFKFTRSVYLIKYSNKSIHKHLFL